MADLANTVSFTVKEKGETTGELWFGKFTAKERLTLRDQLNRDKVRREMLGNMGGNPDGRALSIAVILSELVVRLVETPEWWKAADNGLDLEDANVVKTIYDKAMEIEEKAEKARKDAADEAKAALAEDQKKSEQEG